MFLWCQRCASELPAAPKNSLWKTLKTANSCCTEDLPFQINPWPPHETLKSREFQNARCIISSEGSRAKDPRDPFRLRSMRSSFFGVSARMARMLWELSLSPGFWLCWIEALFFSASLGQCTALLSSIQICKKSSVVWHSAAGIFLCYLRRYILFMFFWPTPRGGKHKTSASKDPKRNKQTRQQSLKTAIRSHGESREKKSTRLG